MQIDEKAVNAARHVGQNVKIISTETEFVIIVDKTKDLIPPKPGGKMFALASSGGFQWFDDEFKGNLYIGKL